MWIERLAREIGALGQAQGSSPERALNQMSVAAARGVPGCSAALVVLWRDVGPGDDVAGRHVVVDYGASHSDLAAAFEHQYTSDQGPAVEAVREMRPVRVGDVLREDRWPGYTSMAVQCGDRSSITYPCEAAATSSRSASTPAAPTAWTRRPSHRSWRCSPSTPPPRCRARAG
jgi:hypothetical protein